MKNAKRFIVKRWSNGRNDSGYSVLDSQITTVDCDQNEADFHSKPKAQALADKLNEWHKLKEEQNHEHQAHGRSDYASPSA